MEKSNFFCNTNCPNRVFGPWYFSIIIQIFKFTELMSKNIEIIEYKKKTPKTELHLHIEGTLEPDHMFELAKRNNVSIPFKNVEEVKSAYNFKNLDSFLKNLLSEFKSFNERRRFF